MECWRGGVLRERERAPRPETAPLEMGKGNSLWSGIDRVRRGVRGSKKKAGKGGRRSCTARRRPGRTQTQARTSRSRGGLVLCARACRYRHASPGGLKSFGLVAPAGATNSISLYLLAFACRRPTRMAMWLGAPALAWWWLVGGTTNERSSGTGHDSNKWLTSSRAAAGVLRADEPSRQDIRAAFPVPVDFQDRTRQAFECWRWREFGFISIWSPAVYSDSCGLGVPCGLV